MLIQNLPPHIRALAEQRRREQPEYHNDGFTKEELRGAFLWIETPEGYDWWREVDVGHVDTPYPPHALKTGQEVCSIYDGEVSTAGLVFIGYWNHLYWCYNTMEGVAHGYNKIFLWCCDNIMPRNLGVAHGYNKIFPVIKPTLTIKEIAEWKGVSEDEAREMVKQIL